VGEWRTDKKKRRDSRFSAPDRSYVRLLKAKNEITFSCDHWLGFSTIEYNCTVEFAFITPMADFLPPGIQE